MTKDLAIPRAEEITRLHNEIIGGLRVCLDKAIRIGELLAEQKEALPHGEFTPWIKAMLPFTDRTARNYMRVYKERDRLKTETVSDLTSAYRLLTLDPIVGNKKAELKPEIMELLKNAEEQHAEALELERLLDYFSDDNSKLGRTERLKGLGEVHDRATKLQSSAMETRLMAARKLGKLLDSEQILQELSQLLNTDYYEFTSIGLKCHRKTTEKEWREYGERLRLAGGILNEK